MNGSSPPRPAPRNRSRIQAWHASEGAVLRLRVRLLLVPKLCLGTGLAKLCFARPPARETEFRVLRSQTEFGNEENLSRSVAGTLHVPQPPAQGVYRLPFFLAVNHCS